MSGLLIAIGAIVAVLGLASVGYGIPVKEFSFGNTLIVSGTIAVIGGLIVVAIGAAILQMRQLAEMLAHLSLQPAAPAHSFEAPAPAAAPVPQPVPFPSRSKPERVEAPELQPQTAPASRPAKPAPPPFPMPDDRQMPPAPMLRNPDAPLPLGEQFEIPEHEDVSLSPPPAPAALSKEEPHTPSPAKSADQGFAPPRQHRPEPPPSVGDQASPAIPHLPPASFPQAGRPAQPSYFESMWPSEARPARRAAPEDQKGEPGGDLPSVAAPHAATEPVAILKSGVVDGMAYTLYVDGSIEAELPSGTVRFASITELREHLAKSA